MRYNTSQLNKQNITSLLKPIIVILHNLVPFLNMEYNKY